MCMLTRPIKEIARTNILVSDLGRGEHGTTYSMDIETPTDVAMLLPVPSLQAAGEDGLRFVDLSGYPDLFKDIGKLYPVKVTRGRGAPASKMLSAGPLRVHEVGAFIASFVPTKTHFHRLDERFRLDPSAWDLLPDYNGFGFAVFQLKANRGVQPIHPMAYIYTADNPLQLFFPTVHVHDGRHAPRVAHFDHNLYYQESCNFPHCEDWEPSHVRVGDHVDIDKAHGLLTGKSIFRTVIKGVKRNADQIITVLDGGMVVHEERGVKAA